MYCTGTTFRLKSVRYQILILISKYEKNCCMRASPVNDIIENENFQLLF